ncbi:ABC transporter substrate-binding protein [Rubrivivax albus]|uniref:Bicyclomycin resistance protein n=1 Tax=Rubrivivax albus TaxID=2499835 RepID=A0A3S2U587_9BURK|nr:ABC transporter substrate-binding protein [Rubrivivax albus]RVT48100.1 bicyclomycin resistance protein [Rubrivivax albus]
MKRSVLLALATSLALAWGTGSAQTPPASADAPRVLRYAFPVAETGFDPAQISDLYSRTVAAAIFDAPLTYAYLARPAQAVPNTAVALPEISNDGTTFTFRIRQGIFFQDDPVFQGKPRELTAADYLYAIKRHYDPKYKSPNLFQLENAGILGLSELRKRLIDEKKPFDYDTEVEGLKLLDRYSFQVRIKAPAPRFYYLFTDGAVMGAVAREVVEHYGDAIMAHPVGTGPFVLKSWRRSSKIVLERNPGYREVRYAEQPPADDAEAVAMAQRLDGRKLPLLDRVEISIIEEQQPRWLAFLNGEHDFLDRLPNEFAPNAIPHNRLAPNLAKQGMQMVRTPLVDATLSYFAMENPVIGGYTPDKVAFRRAMSLAYDGQAEIALVRLGQAVPAQSVIPPLLSGYDPAFKSEMSEHSVAKANALLDLYGWHDKDGDGWRDQPDGSPLLVEYSSQPDQQSRKLQELWRKAGEAVRVRITFKIAKWPEQLKASRAGKLMMWGVAWGGVSPDGSYFLDLLYGPNKGQANHARFDLPEFNDLYRQQNVMPDGPEREAIIQRMKRLSVAYAPYKVTGHRVATDLMHAPVVGYRRHPFLRDFFRYVDVDPALQP